MGDDANFPGADFAARAIWFAVVENANFSAPPWPQARWVIEALVYAIPAYVIVATAPRRTDIWAWHAVPAKG